ncbi:MAG: KpsF/GutQ family sugar-phosphate isomerase [Candidatus Omnitrophica bacterium CG_4_9_14_0_2_um_filter_42_8]|nr:MAG: KpsF/GutQ family sugar-phosphate isomerase [Candidatus Omnitrophica bacterium CG22_combo_CG10-13_8_21_14_all_43_16]PJC48890.1 MAG: KpsF/GutQ family sugar-phosphate isomerase [Candidatus Omnitrophica bacterium CG_4_9_14_0_2_um_filter_42_8]
MLKKRAKQVLKIEADSIRELISHIDKDFEKAVDFIYACKGRVVVTGMGKAGIIGQKISATLSSTGTPSLWLHSAEAIHGDLGRVIKEDVVIVISNSGQTQEVVDLVPQIKKIGSRLIAITGNKKSSLAKNSDAVLDVSIKVEACPLGLAPMASTTSMLAMGDALCAALMDKRKFKKSDFAFLHPGGSLGKQLLLKVEDIMRKGSGNPMVKKSRKVKDVLLAITASRAGSATVIDKAGRVKGIFTDGDLRRHLGIDPMLLNKEVKDVMTKNPRTLKKGCLAVEALRILQEYKIDEIPIVDENKRAIGLVDVQDLLKAGLV